MPESSTSARMSVHAALDLVLRHLAQPQAVGHVVKHVVVREQGVALEHHGGVALVGGQGVDGLAAQIDLALVRAFKARDHAQRGGFAAAGGAKQGDEGTGLHLQRHVVHGIKFLAGLGVIVNFGNMIQFDALGLFYSLVCHGQSTSFCFLLVPKNLMNRFISSTAP